LEEPELQFEKITDMANKNTIDLINAYV